MAQAVQRAPAAGTVHDDVGAPEDTTRISSSRSTSTFLVQVEAQNGAALPGSSKTSSTLFSSAASSPTDSAAALRGVYP